MYNIQLKTFQHIPEGWCLRPGSNRHGLLHPQDFKSCVSANSTTQAKSVEATPGFEPGNEGFADLCLSQLGDVALLGAEDGIRTRDPLLGKEVLYH